MPLDPQVRQFLDDLETQQVPPLHTLSLREARQSVLAEAATFGDPEPVAALEDRTVAGPRGLIPIRVYTPHGAGPFPILVYYHGGGWVLGDIASHEVFACSIANAARCLVVSVEYRLAPEHKYPAATEDAYAATKWVAENAAILGGDRRWIAVGGDSAGGNLAAVVALMARDNKAFRPNLQILIYPVTDYSFDTPSYHENAEGYLLWREGMKWCWRHYLAREEDGYQPYASPLRAEDFSDLPPALVITAQYDPLRDEGEAYAARLREAGVPVTLSRYDGMIHGFIRKTAIFDQAKLAQKEIADALRQAFL